MGNERMIANANANSAGMAGIQLGMARAKFDWEDELKTRLKKMEVDAHKDVANINAKAHVEGIQYGTDRQLEGSKYTADQSLLGAKEHANAYRDVAGMTYGYTDAKPGSYLDKMRGLGIRAGEVGLDVGGARNAYEKAYYTKALNELNPKITTATEKKKKKEVAKPFSAGIADNPELIQLSENIDKYTPDWFKEGRNRVFTNWMNNPGAAGVAAPMATYMRLKAESDIRPNSAMGTMGKYMDEAAMAYAAVRGGKSLMKKSKLPPSTPAAPTETYGPTNNPYDYILRKKPGTAVMPYGGGY